MRPNDVKALDGEQKFSGVLPPLQVFRPIWVTRLRKKDISERFQDIPNFVSRTDSVPECWETRERQVSGVDRGYYAGLLNISPELGRPPVDPSAKTRPRALARSLTVHSRIRTRPDNPN